MGGALFSSSLSFISLEKKLVFSRYITKIRHSQGGGGDRLNYTVGRVG